MIWSRLLKWVSRIELNYTRLANASKIFTRLGYVSIGLEVVGGVSKITEACTLEPDSANCTKTKFNETGRVAGSVSGGALGGYAVSYLTCNLLLGIETAGTSLLWCTIIAGAAGFYGGSKVGGHVLGGTGELIYEKAYH